jgi:hypothetical protein
VPALHNIASGGVLRVASGVDSIECAVKFNRIVIQNVVSRYEEQKPGGVSGEKSKRLQNPKP